MNESLTTRVLLGISVILVILTIFAITKVLMSGITDVTNEFKDAGYSSSSTN